MIIKKIFKLIRNTDKNSFKYLKSAINSVSAKSTVIGRSKVESLKKIGREKKN